MYQLLLLMYQSLIDTSKTNINPNAYKDNNPRDVVTSDIENCYECCICMDKNNKPIINIQDIKGIKRCKCVEFVHSDCLIKWYKNKSQRKCIICNSLILNMNSNNDMRIIITENNPRNINRNRVNLKTACCMTILVILLFIAYCLY